MSGPVTLMEVVEGNLQARFFEHQFPDELVVVVPPGTPTGVFTLPSGEQCEVFAGQKLALPAKRDTGSIQLEYELIDERMGYADGSHELWPDEGGGYDRTEAQRVQAEAKAEHPSAQVSIVPSPAGGGLSIVEVAYRQRMSTYKRLDPRKRRVLVGGATVEV